MEKTTRRMRDDDRVIISNWKEFMSYMSPISFPDNFEKMDKDELTKVWMAKFDTLLDSDAKLFYMCRAETKKHTIDVAMDILTNDEKYKGDLQFDYEALYLGQKKQLLIYVSSEGLLKFLKKYRLPKDYLEVKDKVNKIEDRVDLLVIKRNLAISFDKSDVDVDGISDEINKIRDSQLKEPMSHFRKVLDKVLVDFKSQPKREELALTLTRNSHFEFIREICKLHQLYFHKKYIDGPKNEKFVDMQVLKAEPNPDHYFYHFDGLDKEDDQSEQHSEDTATIQLRRPKDLDSVEFVKLENDRAIYRVVVPNFGTANRIVSVVIVKGNGDQIVINADTGKQEIQITLEAYHHGVCEYSFFSQNQTGRGKVPVKIRLLFNIGQDGKPIKDGNLYLLGQGDKYLIPNPDPKENENTPFLRTTDEKFVKTVGGIDASIGSGVFICDVKGNVAGWGEIYIHKQEGDKSDQKQKEESINGITIISATTQVESPTLFDNGHHIRKISSGEWYCIACDRFGDVWVMGYNSIGQLGLGHTDQSVKTDEMLMAREFFSRKIFIVDVKATSGGASIALDKDGTIYRWGLNQAENSSEPIFNSYKDLINFNVNPFTKFGQPTPFPITKRHIYNPVTQIQAGESFFLALTSKNELYGWGRYENLGLGAMTHINAENIQYLCNPIELMKEVRSVSVGEDHCIVRKLDGSIWGWGDGKSFIEKSEDWISKPTQLKIGEEGLKSITCGPDFTVLHYQRQGQQEIEVIGCRSVFKAAKYQLHGVPSQIICGRNTIGVLI